MSASVDPDQFAFGGHYETRPLADFNLLLGIEDRRGLVGEVKAGTIDSPDFKITIGYTFHY